MAATPALASIARRAPPFLWRSFEVVADEKWTAAAETEQRQAAVGLAKEGARFATAGQAEQALVDRF